MAANDWLGGFGRFCPTDSTVPTTPTGLTTTPAGAGLTVSWNPATDASGAVTFDVYRNNRVFATVGGISRIGTSLKATPWAASHFAAFRQVSQFL